MAKREVMRLLAVVALVGCEPATEVEPALPANVVRNVRPVRPAIAPRVLHNGRPACGNVASRAPQPIDCERKP